MQTDIAVYHHAQSPVNRRICERLLATITTHLAESEGKVWHAHPVWFLDGNPIVGYSTLKAGVRLMFWSGLSFDEPALERVGTFQSAGITYTDAGQIDDVALARWLAKSREIQWDYKNIVKRKGKLERLK